MRTSSFQKQLFEKVSAADDLSGLGQARSVRRRLALVGGALIPVNSPAREVRAVSARRVATKGELSACHCNADPVRRGRAGGRSAPGGGEGAGAVAGAIFGRESRVFKGLRCRFRPTSNSTPPEGRVGWTRGQPPIRRLPLFFRNLPILAFFLPSRFRLLPAALPNPSVSFRFLPRIPVFQPLAGAYGTEKSLAQSL